MAFIFGENGKSIELSLGQRLWITGSFFGATRACVKTRAPRLWVDVMQDVAQTVHPDLDTADRDALARTLVKCLSGEPDRQTEGLNAHIDMLADVLVARAQASGGTSAPRKNKVLAELTASLARSLDEVLGISYFDADIVTKGCAGCETLDILNAQIDDEIGETNVIECFSAGTETQARADLLPLGADTVLHDLNATLQGCGSAAAHWPIDTIAGATFLASCLPAAKGAAYDKVYILHPVPKGKAYSTMFDPALRALARCLLGAELHHPEVSDMFAMLADCARRQNALIVFATANCLSKTRATKTVVQDGTKVSNLPMKPLLSGLAAFHRDADTPPRAAALFLASKRPYLEAASGKYNQAVHDMIAAFDASTDLLRRKGWHQTLRSAHTIPDHDVGNESFREFYRQWEAFCARGNAPWFFRKGNRLKNAYFRYVNQTKDQVWQRSIVMRAAAASNVENMGFADASLGIARLLGDLHARADIASYIRDVEAQLSLLDDDHLRTIRHIAAARYWARESAILDIFNANSRLRRDTPRVATQNLQRKGKEGDGLIAVDTAPNGERRFRATLDVKAIVLDHWRAEIAGKDAAVAAAQDANTAAKARRASQAAKQEWRDLFRLAARDIKRDAERQPEQTQEIPINSYVGLDVQVWPEVFRKLIRSAEFLECPEDVARDADMLAALDAEGLGDDFDITDPRDLYRVCFKKIFIDRFRGGLAPGDSWFSADDRADSTAAEMLQLISKDMILGQPHDWLDADLHQDYHRACATVLHATGFTRKARQCLSRVDGGAARSLFLADSLSRAELETFLHDLCEECGVALTKPFPAWGMFTRDGSEDHIDDQQLFLAVLFLGLRCRYFDPEDIEEALSEFVTSEKLISPSIEPRFAHKVNWAWRRNMAHESNMLLCRLLALFHERQAEAQLGPIASARARLQSHIEATAPAPGTLHALSAELEDARRLHFCHLTKAQTILNTGIHRLSDLNYQNERMRLMVARQRIERFLSKTSEDHVREAARFRAENKLNEMMRRALDFGCAYDVYLEILLESAKLLKEDGRPLRAYAAYARPAVEIAHSIEYPGCASRALTVAMALLDDIEAMHARVQSGAADGARSWEEIVRDAVRNQAAVEWGHGMPIELEVLGDIPPDYPHPRDKNDAPVFGFLLPQAHEVIQSFEDHAAGQTTQRDFLHSISP